MFSEEDKHLIQVSRKTRHLGARRIIKLSRKEMDIKLNAVDYKMWGIMRTDFILARLPVVVLTNSSSASLMNGTRLISI